MTKYIIIALFAFMLAGCSGFPSFGEPTTTAAPAATTGGSDYTTNEDAEILNVLDEAGCDFQAVEISDGKKRQHHLAVVCK